MEHRRKLAQKGQLACPNTLNYPLDTRKHAISAMAYYQHENTVKCKGGQRKICNAYEKFGLTGNEAFKEHCR
jgi:hypothetical protein